MCRNVVYYLFPGYFFKDELPWESVDKSSLWSLNLVPCYLGFVQIFLKGAKQV